MQREGEPVIVENLGNDRQTQPAAFASGRKEGGEHLVAGGGIDSSPRIGDREREVAVHNRYLAVLSNRLDCIADHVNDDLLELTLIECARPARPGSVGCPKAATIFVRSFL